MDCRNFLLSTSEIISLLEIMSFCMSRSPHGAPADAACLPGGQRVIVCEHEQNGLLGIPAASLSFPGVC